MSSNTTYHALHGKLDAVTATEIYDDSVAWRVSHSNSSSSAVIVNGSEAEISENELSVHTHDLKTLLIVCCILGVVVLIGNIFILIVSKFASGGKSPVLVFIRSLCVADAIAGIFAVSKGIQASEIFFPLTT